MNIYSLFLTGSIFFDINLQIIIRKIDIALIINRFLGIEFKNDSDSSLDVFAIAAI